MKRLTPRRYAAWLAICIGLVGAAILVSPGIGTTSGQLGLFDAWRAFFATEHDAVAYYIAFQHRLPRTLLAIAVGITLSLSGGVFQVLFRNSLATPYTLGIASGGALGALLAIHGGYDGQWYGVSGVTVAAFLGSAAVLATIFLFTRGTRHLTTNELLLAGVTLGLFCSGLMMLVTCLANVRETFAIVRWMMGSLDTIGHANLVSILPLIIPSWLVLILAARPLNQYALGDELARTRGVNVARLQVVCLIFASLGTAAVVSICGPIGFVGLVVPHITALLVGNDCRLHLPASALLGGVFLAACDWLSQLAMGWVGAATGQYLGSAILPIGVVTAVIGVPIFLILLRRRTAHP